jgi:hypothetical protein
MFVQGESREQVQSWVDTVRNLRYKDYQLSSPVSSSNDGFPDSTYGSLEEVSAVKEMAARMNVNGLAAWWRKGMGFTNT